MKRSLTLALALVSALGFATSATAADEQSFDDRFYITPMVSFGAFDHLNLGPESNWGGQLAVGKSLNQYLSLELYVSHFNDVELNRKLGGNDSFDSTSYGLSALLFPAKDILPVFALVGIGEGTYDFDGSASSAWDDQDASYVDLGVGIVIPLTDSGIALRSEYRYRTADVDAPSGGEEVFYNDIISLGIQIPIGAPADQTIEPEPAKPTDTDNDGVTDDQDRCPATPKGTQVDLNGCPVETDQDSDGVLDKNDDCTGTPAGTAVNEHGCPVITDGDNDGVADQIDACPGTMADTKVNKLGCVVTETGNIVLHGVHFKIGSSELTVDAKARLDEVVESLKNAKKVEVEVRGHTSSTGSSALNMRLSQERAQSVMNYLTSQGIDSDRLRTQGFGETRPIATNETEEGRAKNRRVELYILN